MMKTSTKIILIVLMSLAFTYQFAFSAGFRFGGIKMDIASTTTAGSTTTLTASSSQVQAFTGSSNQSLVLPVATTLTPGYFYTVSNEGSGTVTVKDSGTGVVSTLTASQSAVMTLKATATSIGSWDVQKGSGSSGASTVYSWTGYHGPDCNFANATTGTTVADFTTDATCTFTEFNNTNMGTVISANNGTPGTDYPGFNFTPPVTGNYLIVASMTISKNTTDDSSILGLYDGSTQLPIQGFSSITGTSVVGASDRQMSYSAVYAGTSGAAVNVRFRSSTNTGTMSIRDPAGNGNHNAITWTIVKIN